MEGWFRLASHLKMSLNQCLKETTYRQYLAWMEWLEKQWNVPSRTDFYLMQIAQDICKGQIKPSAWNVIGSKKLVLSREESEEEKLRNPVTREEAAERARSRLGWLGRGRKR